MVRYEFPSYLTSMIDSYLQKRVVVSESAAVVLEQGCPQGSVLGPLLWNFSYNFVLEKF